MCHYKLAKYRYLSVNAAYAHGWTDDDGEDIESVYVRMDGDQPLLEIKATKNRTSSPGDCPYPEMYRGDDDDAQGQMFSLAPAAFLCGKKLKVCLSGSCEIKN